MSAPSIFTTEPGARIGSPDGMTTRALSSGRWLQRMRRRLGMPGRHMSTDQLDSCQHRTQRFPGSTAKRCWYCSPLYRGRHRWTGADRKSA